MFFVCVCVVFIQASRNNQTEITNCSSTSVAGVGAVGPSCSHSVSFIVVGMRAPTAHNVAMNMIVNAPSARQWRRRYGRAVVRPSSDGIYALSSKYTHQPQFI